MKLDKHMFILSNGIFVTNLELTMMELSNSQNFNSNFDSIKKTS